MTIIDVSIVIGAISLIHCIGDYRKARDETNRDRRYNQRQCEYYKESGKVWLGVGPERCEAPRYGVARRWWERKTYAEIMDEFNSRSLKEINK